MKKVERKDVDDIFGGGKNDAPRYKATNKSRGGSAEERTLTWLFSRKSRIINSHTIRLGRFPRYYCTTWDLQNGGYKNVAKSFVENNGMWT